MTHSVNWNLFFQDDALTAEFLATEDVPDVTEQTLVYALENKRELVVHYLIEYYNVAVTQKVLETAISNSLELFKYVLDNVTDPITLESFLTDELDKIKLLLESKNVLISQNATDNEYIVACMRNKYNTIELLAKHGYAPAEYRDIYRDAVLERPELFSRFHVKTLKKFVDQDMWGGLSFRKFVEFLKWLEANKPNSIGHIIIDEPKANRMLRGCVGLFQEEDISIVLRYITFNTENLFKSSCTSDVVKRYIYSHPELSKKISLKSKIGWNLRGRSTDWKGFFTNW